MKELKDRILDLLSDQDAGGVHDVFVAKSLDESQRAVTAALREMREEGIIEATDRTMITSDGTTSLDDIRITGDHPST